MGKSPVPQEPATVKDRIKQWQEQGGGVIELDELSQTQKVEDDQFSYLGESTLYHTGSAISNDPIADHRTSFATPKRHRLDTITRYGQSYSDPRPRSTPTKRVISDGHWRTNKSAPKAREDSTNNANDETSTEPDLTRGSTRRRRGIQSQSARAERAERRARSERQEQAQDKRKSLDVAKTAHIELDHVNRAGKEIPRSTTKHERCQTERLLASISDINKDDHTDQIPEQREVQAELTSLIGFGDPNSVQSARKHKTQGVSTRCFDEAGDTLATGAMLKGRDSIRSERGKILSQVLGDPRRLFTKQSPEPVMTPRVPSIEAWLYSTPDPFTESEAPIEEAPEDQTKLGLTERVLKPSKVDPNEIWNAVDRKPDHREGDQKERRRNRKSRSASTRTSNIANTTNGNAPETDVRAETQSTPRSVADQPNSPQASTPSLIRRTARKSVSSPVRQRRSSKRSPVVAATKNDGELTSPCGKSLSLGERPSGSEIKGEPGINRRFPSTGKHELSTIASEEVLQIAPQGNFLPSKSFADEHEILTALDPTNPALREEKSRALPQRANSRLTKHSDLISVLSEPRAGSKSIKSARSVRTIRNRSEAVTPGILMSELESDERKYMHELRTLVDGVIPVLLSCVLSKAGSATAAGLFQPSGALSGNASFTRPIVDMGVALERLRSLHKRIPLKSHTALFTWAHGAQRVYAEYLKAWRLGFQDVVVNLASAGDTSTANFDMKATEGLPKDANGNVVNGDGEKVDVAFLLKRPLVRLKYLAKTIKALSVAALSAEAENLAHRYDGLVETARARVEEEHARLEDEAAANIDSTRSRDPRTLAPLNGVVIKRDRRVRARDHFSLTLQHSSGQCVDCSVELILREEALEMSEEGDLLICEVDSSARWLLLPPIQLGLVSARMGNRVGEIIVMIRGSGSEGQQWYENIVLHNDDESTGSEWLQLLGLEPLPPLTSTAQTVSSKRDNPPPIEEDSMLDGGSIKNAATAHKSRTPSPREIEIPIGEQANKTSKCWSNQENDDEDVYLQRNRTVINEPYIREQVLEAESTTRKGLSDLESLPSNDRSRRPLPSPITRAPRSFKEALGLSGTSALSGLRRTKAKRHSRSQPESPRSLRSSISRHDTDPCDSSSEPKRLESRSGHRFKSAETLKPQLHTEQVTENVEHKRPGSAGESPGMAHHSQYSNPTSESTSLLNTRKVRNNQPVSTRAAMEPDLPAMGKDQLGNDQTHQKDESSVLTPGQVTAPSPLPSHAVASPLLSKNGLRTRRSSSPLKRQYEPSIVSDDSESDSISDTSTVQHHDVSSATESSDDEDLEAADISTPLVPPLLTRKPPRPVTRTSSLPTPEGTLKPSDSASQAPYKRVPIQRQDASKTIATIFSWSEKGSWDNLHPDECSIVVSPGLIEAFEMSAAHSNDKDSQPMGHSATDAKGVDEASISSGQNDEVQGERPLVALELTPLVPLRRGTAIDISIRSPPTANSRITTGNFIMFRSRSPDECEALYSLINHARIHNPTYIALQNARGPFATGSAYAGGAGRRPTSQATSARSSWFGGFGRSSSYRARSKRTSSVSPSESSVGTMSSAFSALRRFGRTSGGGMFNIAMSTIISRDGGESGAGSVYSTSDNSSGSGIAAPFAPGIVANNDGSLGLKDAKIRFYGRETASKWRDMGSARLTILQAERGALGSSSVAMMTGDSQQAVHQKRILIHGKTKGEVLLDAQLGETCFERVARTGIAVSVWEDVVGPNGEVGMVGAVGGVAGGRAKVYMIQMKSEAETAYTFSLVGKLRY